MRPCLRSELPSHRPPTRFLIDAQNWEMGKSCAAATSMGNPVIGADHLGPEIDLRQSSAYDLRRPPWMNYRAPDGLCRAESAGLAEFFLPALDGGRPCNLCRASRP